MLNKRFTFLCNEEDRQLLGSISKHLHRSQGDTIRFLIRAAAEIKFETAGTLLLSIERETASRVQRYLSVETNGKDQRLGKLG